MFCVMSLPSKVYFPERLIASQVTNFNACIAAWNSLSLQTQSIWNIYASLNPIRDLSGNLRSLSGFNLFLQSNISLIDLGLLLEGEIINPVGADIVPSYEVVGYSNSLHVDFYPHINFPNSDLVIYCTRPYSGSSGIAKKELYYVASFSNPNAGIFDITQGFQSSLFLNWQQFFDSKTASIKFFVCLVNRVTGLASSFKELVWSFDNSPELDWYLLGNNWNSITIAGSYSQMSQAVAIPSGVGLVGTISPTLVFKTTDFGQTWSQVYTGSGTAQVVALYLDSSGLAVFIDRSSGKLFKSTDFGSTWNSGTTVAGNPQMPNIFKSPFGTFFGSSLTGAQLLMSTDNFDTFSFKSINPSYTQCNYVAHLENGIWLACFAGTSGLFRSVNDGVDWVRITTIPAGNNLNKFCYCGAGIVVVGCGNTGAIFKSVDYGLTWVSITHGLTLSYSGAFTYIGNGVILAGANSPAIVIRSLDYGSSWTSLGSFGSVSQLRYLPIIGKGRLIGNGPNSKPLIFTPS